MQCKRNKDIIIGLFRLVNCKDIAFEELYGAAYIPCPHFCAFEHFDRKIAACHGFEQL